MSIGTKTADYNNYFMALKGNYRKGTNRFRTILANPATAEEYSENLGGCCVVLGWPIGEDDRNSQALLAMLKDSTVISQSVLTWLGQWYSEHNQDADMMYGDATRCAELEADPLMARAVSMDRIALGKLIVTLSGGDCADYADINAVVSSTEAMTAVAAAPAAMQALIVNADAITAAAASETAYQAIFANAEALGAVVASKPAMEAMIASPSALSAMVASEPVMQTIIGSSIALNAMVTSPVAMKAVAASSTAMTAVAASSTAMTAVAASSTAMAAIIGNSTALNAVVSSQTAMTAIAKAPVAMAAIWKNNTAVQKVQANSTAWATFTGASTSVMGKTVAILAGLNPDDYANMTTIAASSTAMTAVAACMIWTDGTIKRANRDGVVHDPDILPVAWDTVAVLEDTEEGGEEAPATVPATVSILDGMTVLHLKTYAANNGIDLGGATLKADIRAAIEAAEARKETV